MKRRNKQRQKAFIGYIGEKMQDRLEKKRLEQIEQAKNGVIPAEETDE